MENAGEPDGVYANCVEVGQNQIEFVLGFGRRFTGERPRPCHTRIILNPSIAQELLTLLGTAMDRHKRDRVRQGRGERRAPRGAECFER